MAMNRATVASPSLSAFDSSRAKRIPPIPENSSTAVAVGGTSVTVRVSPKTMLVDTSPLPLFSRESRFSFVFHPNRRPPRPAVLGFSPPRSTGGLVGLCGGRLGSRRAFIPKTLFCVEKRIRFQKGNKNLHKNLDAK